MTSAGAADLDGNSGGALTTMLCCSADAPTELAAAEATQLLLTGADGNVALPAMPRDACAAYSEVTAAGVAGHRRRLLGILLATCI